MPSRRGWTLAACLALAAAIALVGARQLLVLPANPQCHVRWDESVDAAARGTLEREFGLVVIQEAGPDTWRYELTDASPRNVEAIVRHDAVADTHYIDRDTFAIVADAPLAEPRPGSIGASLPAAALALVQVLPVLLLLAAIVAAIFAVRPAWPDAARLAVVGGLTRGVPELSPQAMGRFRVVLGLVLTVYVLAHPYDRDPLPRNRHRTDAPLVDVEPVHWLAEHPAVVSAGQWVAVGGFALFALGIRPRLTYAVAAFGVTQWLFTVTLRNGSHPYGVLILPLLCLIAVPWHVRDGAPAKRFGYAPWLLAFSLGVAWAGAVYAKVGGGLDWVLDGAVRYHFVTDVEYARVPWGLQIATSPVLSVALSAGSILVESLPLVAAFSRSPWLRLAAALAGMGLLGSFYLFMGLLWPAWWILLLGLLPWEWLERRAGVRPVADAGAPGQISRPQLACVALLAAQQIAVSAAFPEFEPISSRYDMYSKSYSSPAEFDRENPGKDRRIVAVAPNGASTNITGCASALNEPAVIEALRADVPVTLTSAPSLATCAPDQANLPRFVVVEDQCLFNWDRGEFYCLYRDRPVGTLASAR